MASSIPLKWSSPQGEIRLLPNPQASNLDSLQFSEGLGEFDDFRSFVRSRESLRKVVQAPDSALCLAVHQQEIIAYCLFRPPSADERWAEMRPPIMSEVLAETARGWRGQRIMTRLLALLFDRPQIEPLILYIVGYSWTWDLAGTGISALDYRQGLKNLLIPHGFKEYPTNEPNVGLRKENLFMARIGAEVEKAVQKRFTSLLFGIRED